MSVQTRSNSAMILLAARVLWERTALILATVRATLSDVRLTMLSHLPGIQRGCTYIIAVYGHMARLGAMNDKMQTRPGGEEPLDGPVHLCLYVYLSETASSQPVR
ncbi:hypothetical protein F5Y07DRAFT_384827 [Xylaria sp. FL0933]|nr:hypothetical protein F5Y07DRAFT_384827 [Xylaria sp. FL0933]